MVTLLIRPLYDVLIFLFAFFSILSFGAPQPNVYRIVVQGKNPITFETEKV